MSGNVLFAIHAGDGLPIYRQIVDQVRAAVSAGLLAHGDQLPSHRDLARELVIAPLTVKKAYDQLEREGVIETRRGRGTFVASPPDDVAAAARRALADRVRALVQQARVHGLSERELRDLVHDAWRDAGPGGRR